MNHTRVIAATLLMLGLAVSGRAQSAVSPDPDIRALAVRYADGRTTTSAIRQTGGGSWTPIFPRVPGADTSKDGLPLSALQLEERLEGPSLIVTVALLYGSPHQQTVTVATVALTEGRSVDVPELQAFGVKPIRLSIVSLAAPQLHIPSITTPSSDLDVTVHTVSDDAPAYHLLVANRSSRTVMMLHFEAYRGSQKALSGSPHAPGHTPLIEPGESYDLRLGASANGNRGNPGGGWLPLDRVEITSVLWSDGLVEGDPKPAALQTVADAGAALHLVHVVTLLRAAAQAPQAHPASTLQEDIAALSIAVSAQEVTNTRAALANPDVLDEKTVRSMLTLGKQNSKGVALKDLDDFLHEPGPSDDRAYDRWLMAATAKLEGWRTRIVSPIR